jgi:hypothetical protein
MYSSTIQVLLAPPSFFMGGKRDFDYKDLEINELTHSDEELRDDAVFKGGDNDNFDAVFGGDDNDSVSSSFDALFTSDANNNFEGLFHGGDEMEEMDYALNNDSANVNEVDLSDIDINDIY